MNDILSLPQFELYVKGRKNSKHPKLKEEKRVQTLLKEVMKAVYLRNKTGTPLRPVLSIPGWPYFKITRQVAFWLSHVPECKINP